MRIPSRNRKDFQGGGREPFLSRSIFFAQNRAWKRAHTVAVLETAVDFGFMVTPQSFLGFFSKSVASCSNVMFSPIKKKGFYCKIGLVKVTKAKVTATYTLTWVLTFEGAPEMVIGY